jgi:hypothetical protein
MNGSPSADSSKRGAGYYPAGNPDAVSGKGGGGTGCHFDWNNPSQGVDQTDAYDASGVNIVQDANCQCNYAKKGNNWQDWVDQWLQHAQPKPNEQWQYWFGGGQAPSYALDFAACWMNNPKDMIELQNALWFNREKWSNQQIPSSSWNDHDPASQRVYWGWNEVPVDRSVMDDNQNWDAIFIKLPAAIPSSSQLNNGASWQLEDTLDDFVKNGLLTPGKQHATQHPGAAVVFLREDLDGGSWKRTFFCENWKGPQGKWEVVYDKGADLCYIQTSTGPSPGPSPSPSPPPIKHWKMHRNVNCYQDHGATDLETPPGSPAGGGQTMSDASCKTYCTHQPSPPGGDCVAVTWDSKKRLCYRRRDVNISKCDTGAAGEGYTTFVGRHW